MEEINERWQDFCYWDALVRSCKIHLEALQIKKEQIERQMKEYELKMNEAR